MSTIDRASLRHNCVGKREERQLALGYRGYSSTQRTSALARLTLLGQHVRKRTCVAAANVDKFYLTELDGLTTLNIGLGFCSCGRSTGSSAIARASRLATNTKMLSVIKYSNTRLLTSMRYMEEGPRSAEMQDIALQDNCTTNAVC
jgi:hypothetical protein